MFIEACSAVTTTCLETVVEVQLSSHLGCCRSTRWPALLDIQGPEVWEVDNSRKSLFFWVSGDQSMKAHSWNRYGISFLAFSMLSSVQELPTSMPLRKASMTGPSNGFPLSVRPRTATVTTLRKLCSPSLCGDAGLRVQGCRGARFGI